MSTQVWWIIVLVIVTGCVHTAPYGVAVNGTVPPPMLERLAQETVTRMEDLYPPAHTRLALSHPATDAYGMALTSALRRKGYGVVEQVESRVMPSTRDDMPSRIERPAVRHEEGLPFRYIVDGPFEPRLYRITVFIGSQSLSRVYRMEEQSMAQAGAWVRKE